MISAKRKVIGGVLLLMAALPLAGLWGYADHPVLAWRFRLVQLKLLGALPDESWSRVVQRMNPYTSRGGPVPYRFGLIRVATVLHSPQDLEEGKRLFQRHCVQCHGAHGEGDSGPDLTSPILQGRVMDSDIYMAIAEGVEGTSMPGFAGSTAEALRLTAFVRTLADDSADRSKETREPGRSGQRCPSCASIDVGSEELHASAQGAGQWLTYSGSYTGQRFSPLQQINRQTISRLRPRWIYQMKSLSGIQSTPLVVDGLMLLTGPENEVIALDAGTGETVWEFQRVVPNSLLLLNGKKNRGVAILGNRVYHAALDGHLIALDVVTGRPVWDVEVADPKQGFSLTGAPLAVKDKIIVGVAGGDFGTRGFLDAYDAKTGKRVWRFYTIPGPGQPGHESWENDAWKTGGGATWITGSFDPDLNLLYWGVGNPAPVFDGDYRPGDNLYTCSVIALDPDTGDLKWHFQFTPHDTNDWDAGAVPVLADLTYKGELKKLMLWANRNCFFYILDRETGQFLQATEYCEQNWNDGFTETGRPFRRPDMHPTQGGVVIYPSLLGGSSWYPPAYSPRTGLYYVSYRIRDETIYRTPEELDLNLGRQFLGGWARLQRGGRNTGGLRAIDGATGNIVWERMYSGLPTKAALLATAADLLFTVDGDLLYALDTGTGEELWKIRLGGDVEMGPITYLYQGKQQLALIARGSLSVLDLVD